MLERREARERAVDELVIGAERNGNRGCSERVARIVFALDLQVVDWKEHVLLAAQRHVQPPVGADEGRVLGPAFRPHVAGDAV